MKAVIMAGGEGTRLRPLTMNDPKPMLPMVNKPMAEHVVTLLRKHGFDEIVITVAYLANNIRRYFGDGSEFGVKIIYATEDTPLGTAGSVLNARDELNERFLVISGDVLTDFDLSAIVRFHEENEALATIGLKSIDNPLEFGIVITDDDGRIERFLEKPSWGQVFSDTINTGIYVLEPEIFDHIDQGVVSDFSGDVFPKLLDQELPLFGFVCEGYWEDVGDLDAYLRAHEDVLEGRVQVTPDAFPLRPGVWVGAGAEIDPSAVLEPPVVVGNNCRVGAGARIGPTTVLGANVRISDNSTVDHSVIFDNCYLGSGIDARGAVIGYSCDLREGVHIEDGVVIAGGCRIGHDAVVTSGVRIYPNKIVESDAIVTTSIVWESRASRALFGPSGIVGLPNVDLSPELALRAAMAYATLLPKGAIVATSRDSSRAARVLKRAAMVGLNAAGIHVEDLEAATVPMTRFHVRSGTSQGGMTVRLSPEDSESVVLRFLDSEGIDVDESTQRKIERLFYREDTRRVLAGEIGDIDFPPRTVELYTAAVLDRVNLEAIRKAHFKLVLDYAYGTASLVMPNVLGKLGAEVLVVNPMVSTPGLLDFDRESHTRRLSDLVRSSGAHLGALISPAGETLSIIDDTGRVLSDDETLLAMSVLVAEQNVGAKIAVPVNATWRVNEVCTERNAEVIWAQRSGARVVEVATESGASFGGDANGGFVFPEFLPGFDAIAAFTQFLDLLAAREMRLSTVIRDLPPVCVVHETVPTRFEQKGGVMRELASHAKGHEVVFIDGVKTIDPTGWTLVLPDQDEPVMHIYAEADDLAKSQRRADEMVTQVKAFLEKV